MPPCLAPFLLQDIDFLMWIYWLHDIQSTKESRQNDIKHIMDLWITGTNTLTCGLPLSRPLEASVACCSSHKPSLMLHFVLLSLIPFRIPRLPVIQLVQTQTFIWTVLDAHILHSLCAFFVLIHFRLVSRSHLPHILVKQAWPLCTTLYLRGPYHVTSNIVFPQIQRNVSILNQRQLHCWLLTSWLFPQILKNVSITGNSISAP